MLKRILKIESKKCVQQRGVKSHVATIKQYRSSWIFSYFYIIGEHVINKLVSMKLI